MSHLITELTQGTIGLELCQGGRNLYIIVVHSEEDHKPLLVDLEYLDDVEIPFS